MNILANVKALSHSAIFLQLAMQFYSSLQFANIFLTYQTFVTNLHLLRVELRCKLQEKLHRVTGPLSVFLFLVQNLGRFFHTIFPCS